MTVEDYIVVHCGGSLNEFCRRTNLSLGYASAIRHEKKPASREAIIKIHNGTGGLVTFEDLVGDRLTVNAE